MLVMVVVVVGIQNCSDLSYVCATAMPLCLSRGWKCIVSTIVRGCGCGSVVNGRELVFLPPPPPGESALTRVRVWLTRCTTVWKE